MKNNIHQTSSWYKALFFRGGLILTLVFTFCQFSKAQAPASFSYQAVVRDLSNNLLANTTLGVQITIRRGAPNGSNVFRETHNPVTNSAGLVSLEIGMGNNVNGDLAAIDWSMGPFFIEQEIDPNGGTNYTITSTTQLLSVPFALYSRNAERAESAAVADQANSLSAAGAGSLSVPLGTILPYAGSAGNVPDGWLLCDGTAYETNAYPELFALIGVSYGSEQGRFRVPNFQGRTPVGYNINETEFNALGKNGGAKTHTLSTNEIPSHNHGASTGSAGSHFHDIRLDTGGGGSFGSGRQLVLNGIGDDDLYLDATGFNITNILFPTRSAGSHTHSVSVSNTGGGAAHNNLQPYLTINFIIKAR